MGWLEGLLTGYVDRSHEIEKQKMDEAIAANQREAQVFQALLNSPNPKVREMAGVGMLDMANPLRKSKGLRGFLGEVDRSPMLPLIRKYLTTPETTQETTTVEGLPSRQTTGYTSLPSGQRSSQAGISTALDEAAQLPPTPPTEQNENFPRPGAPYHPGYIPEPPPAPPAAQTTASPTEAGGAPITAPQPMPQAPPPPPQGFSLAPPSVSTPQSRRVDLGAGTVSPLAPTYFGDQNPYEPYKAFQGPEGVKTPPLPAPPPLPPESMSTTRDVPGTPWQRTEEVTRYPQGFPTAADNLAATEQAKVRGEIAGLQEAFKQSGDPNWQKSGVDAYLAQHIRATAGSTRAVQTREMIAFRLFGKPGGDPSQILRQITPKQMQRVLEEDNINAAERALVRAKAMGDAPLTAQARTNLIEQLNTKWRSAERPMRDMQRSLQLMEVGVRRFGQDPIGASQAVLITFQKILDPESVVREGEYDRSAQGLAIINRIQGMYDRYIGKWDPQQGKWIGGGAGVPQAELEGMLETAKQFLAGMTSFNAGERQRIEDVAADHEIDPGFIFGGGLRTATPPPPPPADVATSPIPGGSATPAPTPAPTLGGPPAPGSVPQQQPQPGAVEDPAWLQQHQQGVHTSPTTGKTYFNGREI